MAHRTVGVTFGPNQKLRKVLRLTGAVGIAGDVLLLKTELLKKLNDDNKFNKLGLREDATVDDIFLYRIEPDFQWEEEVEDQEIFLDKAHDLFFSFRDNRGTLKNVKSL